ncbi:hypothetical protein Daus18300_009239 [Diaporthe australafricana]|uniref:Uncharacterized protein n=1 Tax=Diaporthe australafricana TaxID=127596 RepID=A0ABR3WF91_9PEZI
MCVLDTDGDSDFLDEKDQKISPDIRTRSRFAVIKQAYRERREEAHRSKIEEIREHVIKTRKILDKRPMLSCLCFDSYKSTEQKYAVWQDCQNSHTLEHGCYKFSLNHRYQFTLTNAYDDSTQTVLHDFRTPEGRKEAFEWLDVEYARWRKTRVRLNRHYANWEETYQKYNEELRFWQRIVLLRGSVPIRWRKTFYKKLDD